jgi:hypothetical protein
VLVDTLQTPAAREADAWNDKHRIGTPVAVKVDGVVIRCSTSSAAWVLNNRAMISCRGLSCAVPLRTVTPRIECWIRMNRRGQKNHWVPTTWDNAWDCRRECERICKEDSRIESYEIRYDEPDTSTD